MCPTSDLKVGDKVQSSHGPAIVRFVGETHFSAGEWVGIELDDFSGKNDGSVRDKSYFKCEMGKGMFVRAKSLSAVGARKITTSRITAPNLPAKPRPNLGLARTSMGPPPKPSLSLPTVARPSLPPHATSAGSKLATRTATSTVKAPPATRLSLSARAGAYSKAPQPLASKTRPVSSTRKDEKTAEQDPVLEPSQPEDNASSKAPQRLMSDTRSLSGTRKGEKTSEEDPVLEPSKSEHNASSKASQRLAPKTRPLSSTRKGEKTPEEDSPFEPSKLQRNESTILFQHNVSEDSAIAVAAPKNEHLETEVPILDQKSLEDRGRLKELHQLRSERDRFEGIIQKLQSKLQPQKQLITDLSKQVKELEARITELEGQLADHDHVLESAVMDKAMAEEETDRLKAELNASQSKREELEMEVKWLTENFETLGEGATEEDKEGKRLIAAEKENERVLEALQTLREVAYESQLEHQKTIKGLQADLDGMTALKDSYEACKQKLAASEAQNEDLRQQLDNASGAQDMIEQLTEQNMGQAEKIQMLLADIKEAEDGFDARNEIELDLETTIERLRKEHNRATHNLEVVTNHAIESVDKIRDMEVEKSRLHETVTNLQSEVEDARAREALKETEAEQLESDLRAMTNKCMKLQVPAENKQAEIIDLELCRVNEGVATAHLGVVETYLPEEFATEKPSVEALIMFKRLGDKFELFGSFVKERLLSVKGGQEDGTFAACEIMANAFAVSATCVCFLSAMSHCSTADFTKFQDTFYELEPVERILDKWIDDLKMDELNEKLCAADLDGTVTLLSHLRDKLIPEGLRTYADEAHMRTVTIGAHLDSAVMGLSATMNMVVEAVSTGGGDDDQSAQHFTEATENVINATRSAGVIANKTAKELEMLKDKGLSVPQDTQEQFDLAEWQAAKFARFTRTVGLELHTLLSDEGRQEPFTYCEIESHILLITKRAWGLDVDEVIFSSYAEEMEILTGKLSEFLDLAMDEDMHQEFELPPPPWMVRSQELLAARAVPVDAEEEMMRLREESYELQHTIALKDQTLEERDVKIELLESRMKDEKVKDEEIRKLVEVVETGKSHERELKERLKTMKRELAVREGEKEEWKRMAGEIVKDVGDPRVTNEWEKNVAKTQAMSEMQTEIMESEASIRYLREASRRAKLSTAEVGNLGWSEMLCSPGKKRDKGKGKEKEVLVGVSSRAGRLLNNVSTEQTALAMASEASRLAWQTTATTHGHEVFVQQAQTKQWRGWEAEVVLNTKTIMARAVRAATMRNPLTPCPPPQFGLRLPQANPLASPQPNTPEMQKYDEWDEDNEDVKIVSSEFESPRWQSGVSEIF